MNIGVNPQTITKQNVPPGYFTMENALFVQKKVTEILSREFVQKIVIPVEDITRYLQRVIEERIETVPRMNQRAIMYLTNNFRVHQLERDRNMMWEEHYRVSQRLYDPTVERVSYDPQTIKIPNRLGTPKVGGTARFWFL